jgi:hypothetical protein
MSSNSPVVVTYEDRTSAIPGVELLARSLKHHSPTLHMEIYSPLAVLATRLADLSQLTFIRTDYLVRSGWNVKPKILLRALGRCSRVFWLDTDIVITGDVESPIERFDQEALVVGQEFRGLSGTGGHIRALAYGLTPARALPYPINSGSILACQQHRSLIEKWSALLSDTQYSQAQRRPISERPIAFVGDQDALWALLASKDFTDQKIDYFRTGSDMIQHAGANGYHVIERVSRPFGNGPVFTHMLGRYKPWSFENIPSVRRNATDYWHMVCFELSPFFEAAQPFYNYLDRPVWLRMRTLPARILNWLFAGNVALRGLPLALVAWVAALIGRRPKL